MARRRARPREARRPPDRDRRVLVWRGVLLVAAGGAGLAGLGVSWYAREGDALTAGLFTVSLLALLALLVAALRRVRRLLAVAE